MHWALLACCTTTQEPSLRQQAPNTVHGPAGVQVAPGKNWAEHADRGLTVHAPRSVQHAPVWQGACEQGHPDVVKLPPDAAH